MPATQETRTSTTGTASQEATTGTSTSLNAQGTGGSDALGPAQNEIGTLGLLRFIFGWHLISNKPEQRSTAPTATSDPTPSTSQESRSTMST